MKVHLDTDFGGDPDDACALAMLLGWSGIDYRRDHNHYRPGGVEGRLHEALPRARCPRGDPSWQPDRKSP
jgi:hypothetical protein